ncbi:MAG: methyltransferase domain-containing protein [Thermoplasmata archaeon]
MSGEFEHQVAEGANLPFSGWDFSPIATRWRLRSPPWDFAALLRERMRHASSMVDLGTGGGEFLASLAPLPRTTFATEGHPPNVSVAQGRLAPLGVRVLPIGTDLHIDLPDGTIDLVADRHEAFAASEVLRILRPRGWFITQQVGPRNNVELLQKFGAPPIHPTNNVSGVDGLADEIAAAGFAIHDQDEAMYTDEFLDIGAVVFYLRAIPWEVPGFSLDRHRESLREIYHEIERTGSFRVTSHRLLVVAQRPE